MSRLQERMSAQDKQVRSAEGQQQKHYLVAGKMLFLAAAMFGFGYLMVPLYDIICEVTGLNGKTGRISVAESQVQLERSQAYQNGVAIERESPLSLSASLVLVVTGSFSLMNER